MARAQFLSLSRLWYTLFIVLIQLVLIYFGIKLCYINDRVPWPKSMAPPKFELFFQKISLLTALFLLIIFIYPSLFRINNFANDQKTLKVEHHQNESTKKPRSSLCSTVWQHCFALSSSLHLIMSYLIVISTVLIDAKQILVGIKDSNFIWRTDLDLLFDWSPSPISTSIYIPKRLNSTQVTVPSMTFSIDSYTRLSLTNFLFASFVCILREPSVFWSISKAFSFIYSFALALNVIQWTLMYGTFQLILKNICYNSVDTTTHRFGYLLIAQPYTAFFLYLLLEFLVYVSSITFYYYGYNRFKYRNRKSTCYDRCARYCPSLIAIILLLLYTSCKMPLVHDIFLLYLQTRLKLLFVTFIFEIVHVLFILSLWIFLTTKIDWPLTQKEQDFIETAPTTQTLANGLTVKNNSIQGNAVSLPELNGSSTSSSSSVSAADKVSRRLSDSLYQKPYEKIRIFQSEIYYRNRPKDWHLPLTEQKSTLLASTYNPDDFHDNDVIERSPSYPICQPKMINSNPEVQYRDAIRKTVSSLYRLQPNSMSQDQTIPNSQTLETPFRRLTSIERTDPAEYGQHHRSATLLISQV